MKKEFLIRLLLAGVIFFLVYQYGFKPMLGDTLSGGSKKTGKDIQVRTLTNSVKGVYDVVVYGEETDGIAAAIAAARLGAKVLLMSEGNDLGGTVEDCLLTNLELSYTEDGEIMNGGFAEELTQKLGPQFSIIEYKSAIISLIKKEKNIDVRYSCSLKSVEIKDNRLTGIFFDTDGREEHVKGRMFIDATRNGTLLEACNVPFFCGSEDLNLKGAYMAAALNFRMKGDNAEKIEEFVKNKGWLLQGVLDGYKTLNANARVNSFKIYNTGGGRLILQGIEIANVDVNNKKSIEEAYKAAVAEAQNLSYFLANIIEEFNGWKYDSAAAKLYVRENRHFSGMYRLSVNEVLENVSFANAVAMGSMAVDVGKFAGTGSGFYIAGKPKGYCVPLGCILTREVENLFMTGNKASYSSIAASSAGSMGTGIATGQAAGITAVFSLIYNISPAEIEKGKDQNILAELNKYLRSQGMVFEKSEPFDEENAHWAYPAVRELLALGLLAGGMDNDFQYDKTATQQDFIILLLNGIYRLDKEKYSLQLDALLRPYIRKEALTKQKAAEILLTLYGGRKPESPSYEEACEKGYINEVLQLRLKDRDILNLDDVYYLACSSIKAHVK